MDFDRIFTIKNDTQFEELALDIFRYQFENNNVYRSFCDLLYKHPSDIKTLEEIPFLPIQFFKSHEIVSTTDPIQQTFTSSGTTGNMVSKHHITDLSYYEKSYSKGFDHFYGAVNEYVVLALLPSYLEREGSSLIYMVNDLIKKSNHPENGFYLNDLETLKNTLLKLRDQGQKVLLIGVSFALLDMTDQYRLQLPNTIIMETGGMKGRRKEITRKELHEQLCEGFGVEKIHSEYGMTELLSQAYSSGDGVFECPPWMQILIRETEDPLSIQENGKNGAINVIDLANVHSCSFIATQDLGKKLTKNTFQVMGRFDHSDIRGCNLLYL